MLLILVVAEININRQIIKEEEEEKKHSLDG